MAKRVQPRFKSARPTYFFREWRKFRGLTQEQLAERVGVSSATISQLEAGKQGFTDNTLEALAAELHCGPGDLLMRNPMDTAAPWSIWENIKPERREQALEILKTFQSEELLRSSEEGPLRLRSPATEQEAAPGAPPERKPARQRKAS